MMISKPTRLGSILVAVLLVLMPAQQLLASVAILNVQPGPGGKPIVRSVTKETVTGDRFETNEKEIQQVLLSDGTSLTLGPGSALIIESFTYDPQTQSGQLNVRLERGQFRVVGGLLNNTGNIAIQTPGGKLDLDNASAFVEVQSNGATRASLLHGKSLKMTTNGKSETVERPAFEVVSAGANQPIKSPSHQDPKAIAADALVLNSQSLLGEQGGGGVGDPGGQGTAVLASLSATGSETPFTSGPLTPTGITGTSETPSPPPSTPLGPPNETPSPPPPTPPPPEPPFTRPGLIDVALNPSTGFGPGAAINPANISDDQPSQANDDLRSLAQTRENAELVDAENGGSVLSEPTREKGRTSNRLFNSTDPFTQVVLNNQKPTPVEDKLDSDDVTLNPPDTNLQYIFANQSGLSLVIDRVKDLGPGNHVLEIFGNYDVTAPFYLTGIELPQPNQIFEGNNSSIVRDNLRGQGSIFEDGTHFRILQAGFFNEKVNTLEGDVDVVRRKADNFLLVEVRPAKVDKRFRDTLKEDFQISGGNVNNPDVFIQKIDPDFTLPLSGDPQQRSEQINSLAAVILNPNVKPGTPLTDGDLKKLIFLSADDDDSARARLAIRNSVNVGLVFGPPDSTARYLFASGDIDSRLSNFSKAFSVDHFFISAGLENFEQKDQGRTVADGIRAFLRKETGLGLNLADTGLLVVNPGPESSATQSTLLHADFGLQGTGSGQQSTISVTIGNVEYQEKSCDCNPSDPTIPKSKSVEAVVEGRTIGSSHGTIKQVNQNGTELEVKGATVGFSSPLRSTAAGGGNPALKNPDGTIREGYAGYFVLENFDPPDPVTGKTENGETPLVGGTENPLGGSGNDQSYAYLRLATATGSPKPTLRNELTLNGWMGGIAEFENGTNIGLTQLDSGDSPGNVEIQTSPTNNTVAANFTLFGQDPTQSTTFNLGGLTGNGTSAFVDDNRFAARSTINGSEVAMVTADLFRDAKTGNLPASLNIPPPLDRPEDPPSLIPKYEHLKWGFFFGDTKTNPGQREHVHLGTWIAGKILDVEQVKALKGTASYSGHSIGNVFNNGSLYTAVGSFTNQWDFNKRTGTVDMNFDKTAYTGSTKIKDNFIGFDGNLKATGRTGELQGSFVAPANPTPAAVMGRFAIAETQGASTYRASGTFGAEQKK